MLLLSRFLTAVFKTFILKVVRRLTTWFREISKSQDRGLNITNRSEIWQAYLWQYCRDVSWISERCDDYDIALRFRDMIFCGKTSYKITRLNPWFHCHPNFSNMTPDSLHPHGSPSVQRLTGAQGRSNFHTVDAVYLRKESQMLTNALRNHSQSPLDGSANM